MTAAGGPSGAEAVNQLGMQLLELLGSDQRRNVVISPISLALCLAVVWNGASGDTAVALGRILGMDGVGEEVANHTFAELRRQLASTGPPLEVGLADAVWSPLDVAFAAEFVRRVDASYGATVRSLGATGPEAAAAVNRWVAERTDGRITTLLGPDDVQAGPQCIVTDAVSFTGPWATPFDPARTERRPFSCGDGRSRTVPMMSRSGQLPHHRADDVEAVTLDYAGGELCMHVLLPAPGAAWDVTRWLADLSELERTPVALTMPRFSETCALDLVRPLAALDRDLAVAFRPGADFRRMGLPDAFISALRHTTRIDVDERGTKAAAGTAAVMGRSLPRTVVVDRPFLVAIADRRSGAFLFLGRINDPGQI